MTTTWQWQLTGQLDTTYAVDAYDIDMFNASTAVIQSLHASGRKVICYLSAGTAENWRPDYGQYTAADLGSPVSGWPGENWVDTRSANVRKIISARFDLAVQKGCDAIEPDNVDGYQNSPGLALTSQTQIDFNQFLATQAHARNLSVALKNDVDQIAQLAPSFDFALNEQCHQYAECDGYAAFTKAGKPVFNAEYAAQDVSNTNGARDALCQSARQENLRTLVLPLALDDSLRVSCD